MSWVAVAVGVGTAAAGMYGSNQAAGSQRAANAANMKIAKMQLAEDKRQFDAQFGQETTKINEMMRQYNLNRADATERFSFERSQAEAQLKLVQDQYTESIRQFEKGFGLQEDQVQETMRQYDLSREDAAARMSEEVRQYEEQFGFEQQKYSDLGTKEAERRTREDTINQQIYGRFENLLGQQREDVRAYTETGDQAVSKRNALMGLSGPEAQQAAYDEEIESPGQKFLREKQEKTLLRNASAIGGLGGGRVRTALQEQAYERSTQAIDDEVGRLNTLAEQGLAAKQLRAPEQPNYMVTGTDTGVL